jgi:hypothetical protein
MWRNSTVCLVGVALGLLGTGCFVDDGDPGYGGGGGGYHPPPPVVVVSNGAALALQWDLAYVDGKAADCESADTPTVNVSLDPTSSGTPYSVAFPCGAGAALATGIGPGEYEVTLDLVDSHGRTVASLTHPPVRLFPDTTTRLGEPALLPVQTWDLGWTIGQRGGRALSCDDVNAASVEFTAQLGGGAPERYLLPCSDYGALTTAILTGSYQVRMLLLDHAGRTIGDTGPGIVNVTMDAPATLDADFDL